MTFISELAEKRQKLLEGLRANEGDINLRIFEDFYPDEAHFIYELLQNAEDAGATEASFELTDQGCAFVHNGPRHFDENDIRAITGIFNSSKKDNPDKIGKFGVGFKSVFVYTDTPVVYSKHYSFRISQLVLPESVPPRDGLGEYTRFEFPFNNAKKGAAQAFSEVRAGLKTLSEKTLLFLNSLRYINWKFDDRQGAILRVEHSDFHIEVLKEAGNLKVMSSHWLRLTAPVEGLERQKVAVAYELEFLGDAKDFDSKKSLAKQMKIVPAERGQVSVFFPAEKETSGLRFHLHAPFVPELSRASIKNSPANEPLFKQLAVLAASSLHEIKALGLLSGEFLAVLPNNEDAVEARYQVIQEAIILEMQEEPLTPAHSGGHSPAKALMQARAPLKKLLTDADLQFLLETEDHLTWAIGATQRNSDQDRFLTSLDIPEWDAGCLIAELRRRASAKQSPAAHFDHLSRTWVNSKLDPEMMEWLTGKTDEWHQLFYATLYGFLAEDEDFSELDDTKIVRLNDGSYSRADKAYFPSDLSGPSDPFPRVSASILTSGSRKGQKADARKLLEALGVRDVGEAEQISLILSQRYAKESDFQKDDVYLADINLFIGFLERNPAERGLFKNSYVLRAKSDDELRCVPPSVYIDRPFKDTGLRAFHEAIPASTRKKYALSDWYLGSGVELSKLATFAEALGSSTTFTELFVGTPCTKNPNWQYLSCVAGERNSSPINRDYSTTQVAYDLLKSKNEEFSRLVWKTMSSQGSAYLYARFQRNTTNGYREAPSMLTHLLSQAAWVPQKDGTFVTPRRAKRDQLLKGFAIDASYKWLELVHFGEEEKKSSAEHADRAKKRADLGFESDEALERAQAFAQLPQGEQERILAEHRAQTHESHEEFPVRPIRNKPLRNQRVRDEAEKTPDKESQTRQRSVAVGYDAIKSAAKLYLREQYTNSNDVMFCQVCQTALPFRLPSGGYYFEAVEAVDGLSKRFREMFLSLCPNHAAMFLYANENRDEMQELVEGAVGLEIEVTLGGQPSTVLFTETHLADIKACLALPDSDEREVARHRLTDRADAS
ncbi:sacsin N-terminal ATP-binding-like domain-containing protein [Paraburkholderia graminis]|uniref:sacsin N-terminal ATP-binding-like domain-containing protein n=1 Tax=Paraburkholderia graminis TaxID=60548 RepID=UPI00040B68BE